MSESKTGIDRSSDLVKPVVSVKLCKKVFMAQRDSGGLAQGLFFLLSEQVHIEIAVFLDPGFVDFHT